MGHLVAGHLTVERPDPGRIRGALPASVGFSVWRHGSLPLFAVDTFAAARPPQRPLSVATPALDLPLELPPDLAPLDVLHERLRADGAAGGFHRAYVALSRLLSAALRQRVLSLYADDDESDFACLSASGKLEHLSARCGDRLVAFEHGQLELAPAQDGGLHAVASRAFEEFTGYPASALGLGTRAPPPRLGLVPVTE
jgi:hypothetical protein